VTASRKSMKRGSAIGTSRLCCGLLVTTVAIVATAADARDPLRDAFRDPPAHARPRVWWHWMNGNITESGIAKDLAWMKRIGIGGAQTFDASLETPQIVDKRLVYMTPAWKQAFRFAASEADRLGLELAIASSPGWSETGGPWVRPEDGLKKLVWSELDVTGGTPVAAALPRPPRVVGPFQALKADETGGSLLSNAKMPPLPDPYYVDIAVLAYPAPETELSPRPTVTDGAAAPLDGDLLDDDDLTSAVQIKLDKSGPASVVLRYATPVTIRSARVFLPGGASIFGGASYSPRIDASDDGVSWQKLADVPLSTVPTSVSFAPTTARMFRLVLARGKSAVASFALSTPGVDLSKIGAGFAAQMATAKPVVSEFRLSAEDRVDRAEAKAGFALVPDYFSLNRGLPDGRGAAPEQVVDLTGRLRADGSLDWTPPKGRWKILRIGYSLVGTMNHPATLEATGLEVDKFDGAAVRRYLDHYLAMYHDAAGPGLVGKRGVRAILTDSIEVGAANWTPRLVAQFKRLRGYDPTPWLPALTGTIIGSRADSDRFLFDFRHTLADLMASEHYGTVAAVAHANGLKVYGEALESGRPSLGDDMAMRRWTDVPMAALWTYPRVRGPQMSSLVDMRGAASVAHIYGQNVVAAESMTSLLSPWASAPADLKRVIDLEFATGVNLPVIHTSVHVPVDKRPGLALSIFGQYFNRNETWAEQAKPWIDYIARNALMLQQGRNVADVAYFFGEEAPLTGLFSDKPVPDAPRSVGFDFVNADALMSALSNDHDTLVTAGGARYRILYLGGDSRGMTVPMLRRLRQLVEGGATVVGLRPEFNPSLVGGEAEWSALAATLWPGTGEARLGKGKVIASSDLESALKSIGVAPDARFIGETTDASILFVHRRLSDGDTYYLSNRENRTETVEAHFRVTGKAPELWHAETGTSEPASYRIEKGETVVPLTLDPDESVHIVFRTPAAAASRTVRTVTQSEVAAVGGPWDVSFQPDRGAPPSVTLEDLAPLDVNADPRVRYFSGVATYTKTFDAPAGWTHGRPLWLDLGDVRELAEVQINGRPAGTAWHAPFRLEIGALVKPGRNQLTVKVANLWVNRLIGDAQPGATRIAWAAGPTYRSDAPLRRSGLIGPVRLLAGAARE
jgi:hypothetical protein